MVLILIVWCSYLPSVWSFVKS
uniref:Uncharacterized protein n=1 Tax=Anguilla anguilla TaxID=7936 RepID=A0A0E9VFQ9_ANGAN